MKDDFSNMNDMQHAVQSIDSWVDDDAVNGAAIAVWHQGSVVVQHVAGEAAPSRPVSDSTLFALASVSKPFTAATVMHVLEATNTSIDTPISTVLPEFSTVDDPLANDVLPQLEALRDRITFRHVLSHTSGLPENVGVKRIRMSTLPTLDEIIDAMCGVPLRSAPGSELRYSNIGPALAAQAASILDGRKFHAILEEDILRPAGLDGIVTRPDQHIEDQIALVQDAAAAGTPSESYNSAYWRALGIPWGGYFGTTRDVLRFAVSFLPDQPSVLSEITRSEMTKDQTEGVPGGVNSAGIHWQQGAWGLGWEVKGAKRHHWTGTRTSPATWCHWGQSGTLVWVDPERSLGLAVFANRTVASVWPLKPARWSELSDAVVAAIK